MSATYIGDSPDLPFDPHPAEFVAWLRANAIPIDIHPKVATDDLEPLAQRFGDARIVALGESTHGTREFFQCKDRIFRHLARTRGFTTMGMEVNFTESLAVDDHVVHGAGEARAALDNTRMWTWNTDEVLDNIAWIRATNAAGDGPTLHWLGFDGQSAPVAIDHVAGWLQEHAADGRRRATDFRGAMGPLADDYAQGRYLYSPEQDKLAARAALSAAAAVMDGVPAADRDRGWELARISLKVVAQCEDFFTGDFSTAFASRDRNMARAVGDLRAMDGIGDGIVVWAHNGHVSHGALPGVEAKLMGRHLRDDLPGDVVNVGFSFHEGGFQAIDMDTGDLRDFEVGPSRLGSLAAALAELDHGAYAIDLRELRDLPSGSPIDAWLRRTCDRFWGAGASQATLEESYLPQDPREHFDLLVFVRRTTPARRTQDVVRDVAGAEPGEPLDLTLRSGMAVAGAAVAGAAVAGVRVPAGWSWISPAGAQAYTVVSDASGTTISRRLADAGVAWGYAQLAGSLDPEALLGHRVTISGEARADTRHLMDAPCLAITVTPDSAAGGYSPFAASVHARHRVAGANWHSFELTVDVPDEPASVTLSLVLAGNGRVSFRDLAVVTA